MQRIITTLLVFVALVSAQSRTSVTQLSAGVPTLGQITNLVSSNPNNVAPVLYSYMIPENASVIYFQLKNLNNGNCTFLDMYVTTGVAPCVRGTYGINTYNTICNQYTTVYSGSSSATIVYRPGVGNSNWANALVNTEVFIGVGTDSSYVNKVCTFSLQVIANSSCAASNIAVYNSSNSANNYASCQPYTYIPNVNNYTQTYNINQSNYNGNWKFPVPANTGSVHFIIESTAYLYAYGRSNSGASSTYYDCSDSSNSVSGGGYIIDLQCYVPESGSFYLNVVPYTEDVFNFTISSSINVCTPGGNVGYNCSFPSQLIDNFTATYSVMFNYTSGYLSYPFRYFYFDAPALLNSSNLQLNVHLENTTGFSSGYAIIAKDNFPEATSAQSSYQKQSLSTGTTVSFLYTFYEAYYLPRNWIGLYCYGSVCNFTISFNTSNVATTSTSTASAATATSTASATATSVATATSSATAATATSVATSTSTSTGAATATSSSSTTASAASTGPAVTTLRFTTSSATTVAASLLIILAAALF